MVRMRTRTNNVDTRVQGLFCTYIKKFLLAKKIIANPDVFNLEKSSTDEMPRYHASGHETYLV